LSRVTSVFFWRNRAHSPFFHWRNWKGEGL